ncbi:MAG: type II toxin-antitoxin system RelB family antitoxin [Devosia sp.]
MSADALVEAHVDSDVKERAAEVLGGMGLSVSDVVRILLTRIADEGAVPFELTGDEADYDAWFRAQVQEALDDPRPTIPGDEVEEYFAKRRAELRRKIAASSK